MSNIPVSENTAPQITDQTNLLKIALTCIVPCFGTVVLFVAGLVVLLVCLDVTFNESQQNNQIVRPDPAAPPAPVVPMLPALVAELHKAKTLGEGRASEAKAFILRHRVGEREVRKGQRLYTDMHSELDGCIDYLRTGLVVRFKNTGLREIDARLKLAGEAMNEFFAWVDALERPKFGAVDPLEAVREMYPMWLESVRAANDEAIKTLREDLDRCRLKSWQDVK